MGFYVKKEGYKKPDVKGPRFGRTRLNILNMDLYKRFKKDNPGIDISYEDYKKIILAFNEKIVERVISHRDGVEFPDQLGYLFIGTCPKIPVIVDPVTSSEYNKKINFKNWDSNQYVCKIFYSNYGTKYKFRNREMWYFVPCRIFKRTVSANFAKNWNSYIKVSPISKVSTLFKRQGITAIKVKKHDYSRRVDFSDTQPD